MENKPSVPDPSTIVTKSAPAQQTDRTKLQSNKNVMPTKKKTPIIRQTKTSQFRMLKANPLLLASSNIKSLPPSVTKLSSAASVVEVLKPTNKFELKASCVNQSINKQRNVTTSSNKIKVNKIESNPVKFNPSEKSGYTAKLTNQTVNPSQRNGYKKFDAKPIIRSKTSEATSLKKAKPARQPFNSNCASRREVAESRNSNKREIKKPEGGLRRSLSAQHFDRKKGKLSNPSQCISRPSDYKSEENILLESSGQAPSFKPSVLPITEISEISFRTPAAHKRRTTRYCTPGTNRKSLYQTFSPCTPVDLHRRLSEWLERKNKSVGSFHHLRCFGLHHFKKSNNQANKENDATLAKTSNETEKSTSIIDDDTDKEKSIISPTHSEVIWKEALSDLHTLVLEDYPHEHCETWLRLIHDKYKEVVEEPRYWECRAAIEQSRGNITSAVECYKHAIVQGAEIKAVDKSLEQLLEKFSLLNINSDIEDKTKFSGREKILKDARNVFKSTIIQFAVQERALKKQETADPAKRFYVTPVRRSTRHKSGYTTTPGVQFYTSLKELDVSVQDSIDFHPNKALC